MLLDFGETPDVDYDETIDRITGIYSQCAAPEKQLFEQILQEVADKGYSQTLEQVWLRDFTEVPVSIDEFLCNENYLGATNDKGSMVYPFWRKTLREIFTEGNNYSEIIFSGATRIGKTSTAISGVAYMLYRLMIYRDPHKYFRKKSVSKFTIAFANLTKELSRGVGYREYNDTLKQSEWFCKHGTFSRSEQNYVYIPEGDRIEIIPASDSAHLLGKQLWACVPGHTKILTTDGYMRIDSMLGYQSTIVQLNDNNELVKCEGTVVQTKYVTQLYELELEDGSTMQATSDHLVMLTDGSYKKICELQENDDVMCFNIKYDATLLQCLMKLFGVSYSNYGLWEYISGTKNRYAVCSSGKYIIRVPYKCDTRNWILPARIQKFSVNADGYYTVIIHKVPMLVHRVVALTFIENANNLSTVNHIDGNKLNNDVSNLEWCTSLQNTKHFYTAECFKEARKLHNLRQSKSQSGRKRSTETRKRMSESHRGITFTLEHRKHISESQHGHDVSKITREKISKKNKQAQQGKVWVHNNVVEIRANNTCEADMYVRNGYKLGRLPRVWVNNKYKDKHVLQEEAALLLSKGWMYGRVPTCWVHNNQKAKKIPTVQLLEYKTKGWVEGRV